MGWRGGGGTVDGGPSCREPPGRRVDGPLRVLWTLVGQTPGELRVAALKNQEVPRPPLCLLETGLPPSCPMHKSTVCAHGVVLASGTRYLGGGPSGWRVLPEAGQGDGPRGWRLAGASLEEAGHTAAPSPPCRTRSSQTPQFRSEAAILLPDGDTKALRERGEGSP